MVTSPADFVIGTLRQLDMPMPDDTQFEAQYRIWRDVFNAMAGAGQELGEPPNVAGWVAYYQEPIYDEFWMDSATYASRLLTYQAFTTEGLSTPNNLYQLESQGLQFKVDFVALVQQFTMPDDPNLLVAQAADLLFAVDVSQEVKDQLKTNYLLFGQQNDQYWGDAYQAYVQNPDTMDVAAQLVPSLLMGLFLDMQGAAEHQLL